MNRSTHDPRPHSPLAPHVPAFPRADSARRPHRRRGAVATLVLILALLAALLVGFLLLTPDSGRRVAELVGPSGPVPLAAPWDSGADADTGAGGEADGVIEYLEEVSIDDTHLPAISGLDPELREAVRAAVAAAAEDGVEVRVASGWRSHAYQQRLLDEAIQQYGSAEEAARWVSTPEDSRHTTGDAVDIGPFDATLWMESNGPRFGLCRIYANELWHYELVGGPDGGCPPLREDAAG